jgi:hypothetical protein
MLNSSPVSWKVTRRSEALAAAARVIAAEIADIKHLLQTLDEVGCDRLADAVRVQFSRDKEIGGVPKLDASLWAKGSLR